MFILQREPTERMGVDGHLSKLLPSDSQVLFLLGDLYLTTQRHGSRHAKCKYRQPSFSFTTPEFLKKSIALLFLKPNELLMHN